MHSRGFVLSENQAFAGQTRTPGPSRLHASPTRKNMTTGKTAMGQSSKLTGQDLSSAGPKQLFGDLKASQSPVKALGNRNASKTPGPSRSAPGKQDASIGKGKGVDSSPTKKGAAELSPRKASTSNALRSLNGKQRQTTDLPFSKPSQKSTNGDDASQNMMKTPAPTLFGKARTMSRQNSFVTPAANVGRAGAIKARMGEILDAEMGLSVQKGDNATEQVTEEPALQLTEEEMYPEIEYMPPSHYAKHPVFEFPDELDDLPRAKELGARLSAFSTRGIRSGRPDDLSDVEVTPMEEGMENDLEPPTRADESDDDDPWPDVLVTDDVDIAQQASQVRAKVVPVHPKVASRPTATSRTAGVGTGTRLAVASRSTLSSSVRPPATSSAATPSRTVSGRAPTKPIARSNGLQRSIAPVPGSRAVSSTATTAARSVILSRSTATTARPATSLHGAAARSRTSSSVSSAIRPAQQSSAPKTKLNPKLIDFIDDDLGKQTAAALDRLDADDDLESLQLDLGEISEVEA